MRKRSLGLGLAGLLASTALANANTLYFAMPVNYDQNESNTVFIYGPSGTTGSITSPSGFSSSYTVGATQVTSVGVPNSYDLNTSGLVTNNGFTITTTDPNANVGASYLSRQTATTDMTYLFNSTALGTSYYAMGATNSIGYPSQVSIVGTQNGTTVTITPSVALAGGHPAGTPFNVTVNAGQAVLFTDTGATGADVTGTRITSTAPIAVFGGNQCVDVPSSSFACDHTVTALPSTDHYTTHAVVPTTAGTEGTSSNIVRVLAATDGTTVSYNGTPVATLNAGQYVDFRTGAVGGEITANNPVLVNEYLTGQSEHPGTPGDPAQSYIPGVDQWLKDYIFSTPVGSEAYQNNFLDLVIAALDAGSLLLNGAPVPLSDCTAITGSSYLACEIAIAAGSGEISADNPFLLLINGGTAYDSFLTFAGTTYSAGASPPPETTIPEPASLALLGLGLGGLGLLRRRAR